MNRSTIAVVVSVMLAGFSGCTGKKATGPDGVAKLPTTPLNTVLVIDSSEVVVGVAQPDSSRLLNFGETNLFRQGTFSDIAIGCVVNYDHAPLSLEVFNDQGWEIVEGALPPQKLLPCGEICWSWSDRLASQLVDPRPVDLVNAEGYLRLRALGAWDFSAQLIEYSDDYHFVTVRTEDIAQYSSLTYQNGVLYNCSDFYPYGGDHTEDSLVALDLEGNRLWAVRSMARGYQAAFDGEYFWVLLGLDGPLVRIDTLGQIVSTIAIGPTIGYVQAMTWADGALWIVGHTYSQPAPTYEVDVDSTLASGNLVYNSRFSVTPERLDALTSDSLGLIVATRNKIYRYSMSGGQRDMITIPVPWIDAIAWDGESLWVLHHGPWAARTDATLLSRFELE